MRTKRIATLFTALVLLLGTVVPVLAVTGLGINSWLLAGASNQGKTCAELDDAYADVGTTWVEFKLELGDLANGTYTDGTIEVTLSNYGTTIFDWASNIGVDAIVVKDGVDGADFYVYDGLTSPADGTVGPSGSSTRDSEATSDTGLTTPGGDKDISHISFCYDTGDETPSIDIEKSTNGQDADIPTGPIITVGDPVNWQYVVHNTGNVELTNVTVTDDRGVTVSCPQNTLDPDESMTCTASGVAAAGQYANLGTATGTPPVGNDVSDEDPSHYFGAEPSIDIEKSTNGQDADIPTGPIITVGDPVNWQYVVHNTGNVELTGVTVTDDQGVTVSCPQNTLDPDESMTCTASGVAAAGQYANLGTATGTPPVGDDVSDEDPSHYFGEEPTAITLASFTAEPDAGGVTLAWETAAEIDNAGFNLYRAAAPDGPYTKVNSALIAAQGSPASGASYSFVDEGLAPGTYTYKLEDVDLNGVATLHGPFSTTLQPNLRRPSYRPTLPD